VTQPPSPYSQQGSDEQVWRRPADGTGSYAPPVSAAPAKEASTYAGPPQTVPASANWRPQMLIQVPEAHSLPAQDDAALDEQDRAARTVTYGVGMLAGAIALLVLIVLCGRILF
jgi:hypothetical protein